VSTALRSPSAVDANVRVPHPGGRARRRARTGGPAVHAAAALRARGPRPGQAPCASHHAPLDRPRSLPVHVAALRSNHLAAAAGARRVHRRAHARRRLGARAGGLRAGQAPCASAPRSLRATSTALDETSTPSCQAFWAMRSGPLRVDPSCPEPPRSLRRPRHPAPRAHCAMEWPQAARDIAQPRAIDHSPPVSTRASATQVGPTYWRSAAGEARQSATTSWTAAKLSCGAVRDERSTRERGTRPEVEARRGRAGTGVARAEHGEAAALVLGGPTDARTPGVTNQDASIHHEVFPANGRGVDGASALELGGLGAARTPGLPSHDASNPHAVFPASKRWGACATTWVARGRGSRAEVSPAQGADLRLRRRTSGNYLGRARSPPQRSGSVQR
jgi:hypothetical protein